MEVSGQGDFHSELCKFMNHKFAISSQDSEEDIAEAIKIHFWKEYHVNSWNSDDLFMLKVDKSLSDSLDLSHVKECTGIVLRRNEEIKHWEIVARPFCKVLKSPL
jgi:hypothetical protein